MSRRRADKLPIRDRVQTMSRLSGLAQRHYGLFRFYKDNVAHLEAAFGRHFSFVVIERHGHQSLSFLHLGCILDKGEGGLGALLADVEGEGIAPEVAAETRTWMTADAAQIERVLKVRHGAIAHRSTNFKHDDVYRRFPVKSADFERLLSQTNETATGLAGAYGVSTPSQIATNAVTDLRKLFDAAEEVAKRLPDFLKA